MENDLVSLYENNYLKPQTSTVLVEKKEVEDDDGKPAAPAAKKKKKISDEEIGATLYDSHDRNFNSTFQKFMEEFDMGDNAFSDEHDGGEDDNTFEFDDTEKKDSYTLEELKGMTLAEIADLLADVGGEGEEGGDEGFDFGGDDSVPTESYGHEGGGKHLGNTQTRDGKPNRQAATTRVKPNGDADFSKQKTGFGKKEGERLF